MRLIRTVVPHFISGRGEMRRIEYGVPRIQCRMENLKDERK